MEELKKANVIVQGCVVDTITISPFDIDYFNKLQELYSHPISIGYTYETMLSNVSENWESYTSTYIKEHIIDELLDIDEEEYESHKFSEDMGTAIDMVVSDLDIHFISGDKLGGLLKLNK